MPFDGSSTGTSTANEPHVISPTLRKKLQQCYDHGMRLLQQQKYDYDYAHSILLECVVNDPGNLVYVDAFLQNLQRKYGNNKRGSLLAFGGKGAFRKAVAKKSWMDVFKLGPPILKSNPWDVATLRGLADACAFFGYTDVELRYLKNALDANPKDAEVNKHCALSLARIGQFDQAIACWQRVDEINRGDDEAQRMISDLQIAKTHARGGFSKGETERRAGGVAKTKQASATAVQDGPAESTQPPRREIKLTPRQQLEQAIANNPTDIDSYLELAELHVNEERLGEAAHVLGKALAASGNQLKVQERIEDVELLRKKQQLAIAERRAEADASESNQELVMGLREDLNRMEMEVLDRRSQRYPGDLELKFQLGLRLKRMGKPREALSPFEQALRLPARRAEAALEYGECLQRLRQYEKALKQYWIASEESSGKSELKKLALYRLGVLAEGLRHFEDAQRSLSSLVALDPSYRDAATRLDKIRTMRHKQP